MCLGPSAQPCPERCLREMGSALLAVEELGRPHLSAAAGEGAQGLLLLQGLPFIFSVRGDFKYQLLIAGEMTFCFLQPDIIAAV